MSPTKAAKKLVLENRTDELSVAAEAKLLGVDRVFFADLVKRLALLSGSEAERAKASHLIRVAEEVAFVRHMRAIVKEAKR